MPARFDSGVYPLEIAKLMSEALNGAWAQIQVAPREAELTRLLLASAIIDLVEAGVVDHDELVAEAIRTFHAAESVTKGVVQRL